MKEPAPVALTELLERWQVPVYLGALAVGAAAGLGLPALEAPAAAAVMPALALLLYATFLGVPFARLGDAARDGRFLLTVLAVSFVAAPVVAFGLSRFVAHERALLVGVLLVLLTPCVDYVIAFTSLAGGAHDRLLAAAPLLMLVQALLLPVLLVLMAGPDLLGAVEAGPFLEVLLWIIAAPLAAAVLTQLAARRSSIARALESGTAASMVPVLAVTLALVVASQVRGVTQRLPSLLHVVPIFVAFAVLMLAIGIVAGKLARLDAPRRRAVVLSGITRNSLVVLPLALALPAAFDLAPLVVVTQTLVELLVLVLLVRLVPRLVR